MKWAQFQTTTIIKLCLWYWHSSQGSESILYRWLHRIVLDLHYSEIMTVVLLNCGLMIRCSLVQKASSCSLWLDVACHHLIHKQTQIKKRKRNMDGECTNKAEHWPLPEAQLERNMYSHEVMVALISVQWICPSPCSMLMRRSGLTDLLLCTKPCVNSDCLVGKSSD